MSGLLIDTNVISEFVKPHPEPNVIRWFQKADPATLFASVVTLGENRLWVEDMPMGKRRTELELWLTMGCLHGSMPISYRSLKRFRTDGAGPRLSQA